MNAYQAYINKFGNIEQECTAFETVNGKCVPVKAFVRPVEETETFIVYSKDFVRNHSHELIHIRVPYDCITGWYGLEVPAIRRKVIAELKVLN